MLKSAVPGLLGKKISDGRQLGWIPLRCRLRKLTGASNVADRSISVVCISGVSGKQQAGLPQPVVHPGRLLNP